jgi:N-acetylmuramoyl-L-alanine amidase
MTPWERRRALPPPRAGHRRGIRRLAGGLRGGACLLAACLLLVLPLAAAAAPKVSAIRHWTAPDHTRVVLDLDGPFEHRVTSRPSPERIIIDLPGTGFACGTENRPVEDELLSRIRCNRLAGGAQVVLDLRDGYRFKYFALDAIPGEKPHRLVVDIFPTRRGEAAPKPEAPKPSLPVPPVERPLAKAEPPVSASPQAVAEAPSAADSAALPGSLAAGPTPGPVAGDEAAGASTAQEATPEAPKDEAAEAPAAEAAKGELAAAGTEPASAAAAPPGAERLITVVIDAGHGGEDPGAIYKGKREKDITLDIAKRLQRLLEKTPGYRPVLTRTGDYYISLARRRELADKAQGDLLISIHCNTAPSRSAGGIELYTLSTEGASSRRAQALADLENRADLVGGIFPGAGEEEYRLVLSKQLKTAIERSGLVAAALQAEARRDPVLRANRRLKRAGFAVCKMVSMPSVLVEVGFFTNGTDFPLLTSAQGRQSYAEWLARGVSAYFAEHRHTLYDPLFARREKLIYKVKPGDNLSGIAKRFGVSVDDLVRVNSLRRADRVNAGELLLVMSEQAAPVVHRVKPGENLTLIAKRYGVTVDSLRQANRLQRDGLIRPGQELVILPEGEAAKAAARGKERAQ